MKHILSTLSILSDVTSDWKLKLSRQFLDPADRTKDQMVRMLKSSNPNNIKVIYSKKIRYFNSRSGLRVLPWDIETGLDHAKRSELSI